MNAGRRCRPVVVFGVGSSTWRLRSPTKRWCSGSALRA